jgi:hypothetical protein
LTPTFPTRIKHPIKHPSPGACLREAASAKAGEEIEGGIANESLDTLTPALSHQGRGRNRKINKLRGGKNHEDLLVDSLFNHHHCGDFRCSKFSRPSHYHKISVVGI